MQKLVIPSGGNAVLLEKLQSRLIGHDDSCRDLLDAVTRHQAGLGSKNRPVGSFLLVGPTGSGKTICARSICDLVTGKPDSLLRIDCAEYSASHEISKLLGCFVPGTQILMSDGSRKVIEDIAIGDLVLSGAGKSQPVEDTYKYDCDSAIVKLRIAGNNKPVEVTPGHMVWAKKGWSSRPTTLAGRDTATLYNQAGFCDIPAGQLEKGDVVCFPRMIQDKSKQRLELNLLPFIGLRKTLKYTGNIDAFCLARVGGYYVSEGGNSKARKSVNFTFGLHEQHLVDDLQAALRSIGYDSSVTVRKYSFRVYAYGRALAKALAEWFGDRVDRKRIPEWLMHAPDYIVWEFLDAAFMGDGGKTVRRRVDYSTVSLTLASQLEVVIRRLGFVNQLQEQSPTKSKNRLRYRLYISGAQLSAFLSNCRLLAEAVDCSWGAEQRQSFGIQRNQGIDSDYAYARIVSVERIEYTGPVYDFSVAKDHSYVVAMRAHNSPPGYLGHRETTSLLAQSKLTAQTGVNGNRISIVLFDEIDKAHDKLLDLLLGIMDAARLTLGDNNTVDFSNTLVLMTANMGAKEMQSILRPGWGFARHTAVDDQAHIKAGASGEAAAKKSLRPEFINRLDKILVFHQLTLPEIEKICDLELAGLEERCLTGPGIGLSISESARKWLAARGYEPEFGARHLRRQIERLVEKPIAALITSQTISSGQVVRIDLNGEALDFYA